MLLTYVIPFHLLFLFPFTWFLMPSSFPTIAWLCMFSFSDFPEKFSKVVTVVFQANYKLFSVLFSTCMWSHSLRVNQVRKSWLLLLGFQWFASVITHNKSVNTRNTYIFFLLLSFFNFNKMFEKMIKFRFNDKWTFKSA